MVSHTAGYEAFIRDYLVVDLGESKEMCKSIAC